MTGAGTVVVQDSTTSRGLDKSPCQYLAPTRRRRNKREREREKEEKREKGRKKGKRKKRRKDEEKGKKGRKGEKRKKKRENLTLVPAWAREKSPSWSIPCWLRESEPLNLNMSPKTSSALIMALRSLICCCNTWTPARR